MKKSKSPKKPERVLVGKYELALRTIRLFVQPNVDGGSVKLLPDDIGSTKVLIGINCTWHGALTTLLHELYEAALIDLTTRYSKCPSFSSEASDFIFFMTHNQLGEAHEIVASILAKMLPQFQAAYKVYSPYKDSK